MRYTPIKQIGKRGKENQAARARIWPEVLKRAGFRCEGCGAAKVSLQWAHVCGRPGSGMCLGEIANSIELTAALCHADTSTGALGCHEKFDRYLDLDLRFQLRQSAFIALATRFKKSFPVDELLRPDDGIRRITRELEQEDLLGRSDLQGTVA